MSHVVVDAADPPSIARFWSRLLDWQAATVARAIALGARRIDVGQEDVPWVVLADPEGNEVCVLTPR